MYYSQIVQQIVDWLIFIMTSLLVLFTLSLILLHFIINAKQKWMQRIKDQVLRTISVPCKIERMKKEIQDVVNSQKESASLREIHGIRSHRGIQVLEMVSREINPQQKAVLHLAVSEDWYARCLQKKLTSRSQDSVLLTTKLIGQLHVRGYEGIIEQNLSRWPKDTAAQDIGLLALFVLGEKERLIRLFSDPKFPILLSFRALHELFLCYSGDHEAFYRELFPVACDQYIQRACIRGIGEDGFTQLCDSILPCLTSPRMNILLESVRTLGKLHYMPAVQAIRNLTAHPAWEVRCAAIDALVLLDRPGCYVPILHRLSDKVWWVRFHAAEALASLPCRDRLLADVRARGDRYAQEMLEYIIERDEILAGGTVS